MLQKEIHSLLKEINSLSASDKGKKLPQNVYYLDENKILCLERERGDSRFPYTSSKDLGTVLFAHSDGYIDAFSGMFNIFKTANYNEDVPVAFFAGIKDANGKYLPLSVTGAARQLSEPMGVNRYLVYTLSAAYYILTTGETIFALRIFVEDNGLLHFTFFGENAGIGKLDVYAVSFFEALLRYIAHEDFFNRMTKYGRILEDGSFILNSLNATSDSLVIKKATYGKDYYEHSATVSKNGFCGASGRNVTNAKCLLTGEYTRATNFVNTTDLPIASDIFKYKLDPGDTFTIEYTGKVTHDEDAKNAALAANVDLRASTRMMRAKEKRQADQLDNIQFEFGEVKDSQVDGKLLEKFLGTVRKQVSFCAFGRNYAGSYLGIRDVFQQLESAVLFAPDRVRERIPELLGYILSDGRPPRQVSIPNNPAEFPQFDLREYIDQGIWIINTVFAYLSFTGDYTVLNEKCGYFKLYQNGKIERSKEVTDVLEHVFRIADFLCDNIDEDTKCLKVLAGDWNDAMNGIGSPTKKGDYFGTGVTVMGSLQLYEALAQMMRISIRTKNKDRAEKYEKIRDELHKGIIQHGIDTNKDGRKRIIRSWGDKKQYLVGSFHHVDGASRVSLSSTSFFAISGVLEKNKRFKKDILREILTLDSKYGLKTTNVPFTTADPRVGRISLITPGTYENSAVYCHASLFGIDALYAAGYSSLAWNEIEKIIPITHDNCTRSPFVMPNSYCENKDLDIDGESMGDWYTGSGSLLLKTFVKYVFGILPTLNRINIIPPSHFPFKTGSVKLTVKGTELTVAYKDTGKGKRQIKVNGKAVAAENNELLETLKFNIPYTKLGKKVKVEIID